MSQVYLIKMFLSTWTLFSIAIMLWVFTFNIYLFQWNVHVTHAVYYTLRDLEQLFLPRNGD